MWLSDTSIKRPVFASVVSLLLVIAGAAALKSLPLREYPNIDAPVVSVQTDYLGAAAAVVDSRITQVIEDRVAGIEGVRFIESNSEDGRSTIKLEFALSRNMDDATNDVRDRVSRALPSLPPEAKTPDIQKVDANEDAIIWFNFASDTLTIPQLTDYANRYLIDQFSTLPGVARVRLGGSQTYAMRVWLDIHKLNALQLTVDDIEQALRRENIELPAGALESVDRQVTLRVERRFSSAASFAELVVKHNPSGGLVRLGDLAKIEKSAVEYRSMFRGNGSTMIGLGIIKQSTANTLTVARAAKAKTEQLNHTLPKGLQLFRSYDTSVFIEEAINEVYRTFAIAACLVILSIYLFLGDVRATLIPAITVPISLVATFSVLKLLGYSLNMLTLLALILSVGLVVDDAIVVLENIHRRMRELGETALLAAYRGTREVGFAVIATTLVLTAVFIPIAFIEGDLGRLFAEFAVTMSTAVLFSALVALTLAPVIACKLLNHQHPPSLRGPAAWTQTAFMAFSRAYQRRLNQALTKPWLAAFIVALSVVSTAVLLIALPKEYVPNEDRGTFNIMINGPEGASYNYMEQYLLEIEARLLPFINNHEADRILMRAPRNASATTSNFNMGLAIVSLQPWQQRRDAWAIMADMRNALANLPGVQIATIMRQGLSSRASKPVEVVLAGGSYEELAQWRDILFAAINENNPGFSALDSDYKQTSPQLKVDIQYERAAQLGVSIEAIGRTLETLLASRRATTFIDAGEEYDVLLQGDPEQHRNPQDLDQIQVRSITSGEPVSLANLVKLSDFADAKTLNRFNRNRAITLEANLDAGYSLDTALTHLEQLVKTRLPETAQLDYKGRSRAYKDASHASYLVFILGILVMFLVLAAQFESYINPLVITLTLPLAIAGGLLGIWLSDGSLNLYSQIGLIMLLGLAAKNGILIVEFANQKRDQGLSIDQAIREAAQVRLRPIIMTNITALAGAVPLMISSGAGAETRNVLGVTLFSGILSATIFTLFVVPLVYRRLAPFTQSPNATTHKLQHALQDELTDVQQRPPQ